MTMIGHGSTLHLTHNNTDMELGEITDINIGGLSMSTVDRSNTKSPDRYREFMAGMRDAGEITCTTLAIPQGETAGTIRLLGNSAGVYTTTGINLPAGKFPGPQRHPVYIVGQLLVPWEIERIYYIEQTTGAEPYSHHIHSGPTGGAQPDVAFDSGDSDFSPMQVVSAEGGWFANVIAFRKTTPAEASVHFPSGTVMRFPALVTTLAVAVPTAEAISTTTTLKITGKPTWQ